MKNAMKPLTNSPDQQAADFPVLPSFDFYFLVLWAIVSAFSTVNLSGPLLVGYCLLRPVSRIQHIGFEHPKWQIVWPVLRIIGFIYGLVLTGKLAIQEWGTIEQVVAPFVARYYGRNYLIFIVPSGIIVAVFVYESIETLFKEMLVKVRETVG